jgi:citrate synthase
MEKFSKERSKKLIDNNLIDRQLYDVYNVKRGLRNDNGTGVIVGLTKISSVIGYDIKDGKKIPTEGRLLYRGYDIKDLVQGMYQDGRYGFEEITYLLLFGTLPTTNDLEEFTGILGKYRDLPPNLVEDMILKFPSSSVMNKLMRTILVLYSFDEDPEVKDYHDLLNESIRMIARFPTIVAYGHQAKAHYFDNESLIIHYPRHDLSTAEYLLYLIRPDGKFTKKEAETLDMCLLLHADHGANNSSFATHVLASSGTDIYSVVSSAVGSLKGMKHGGANLFVAEMIEDIKANCNYKNKDDLKAYLTLILHKKANDKTGLIYGMGHAVYTLSDPRAVLLKEKALDLAKEKGEEDEYQLYLDIEAISKDLFKEEKGIIISANVDLYSGFIYSLLGIPKDLYTPIFAISRVSGWVSHRIEQLISDDKILRPAYVFVDCAKDYVDLKDR